MVKFRTHRSVHHTTNRLRILRAERRWSQSEVAARIGHLSRFRYWQIENEETAPTADEVRRLTKIFRCSETEIFPVPIRREVA